MPPQPLAPPPVATDVAAVPATAGSAAPARPFHHLSLAEQLERRRQGLYYNCDEPYVRGHVFPQLFYLESMDFLDDEVPAEVAAVAAFQEDAAP